MYTHQFQLLQEDISEILAIQAIESKICKLGVPGNEVCFT
jgi:hypothetical protein